MRVIFKSVKLNKLREADYCYRDLQCTDEGQVDTGIYRRHAFREPAHQLRQDKHQDMR
jgi:hypothetical protein